MPANPTKTGYTFDKWVDADGNEVSIPATMPAENLTVKATWTATAYTITFVVPDGIEIESMTYIITDTKTLPVAENSDATMYAFDKWVVSYADGYSEAEMGWGKIENGVAPTVAANSTVTGHYGNVTLTATWTKAASVVVEEYKYADNDQYLLRVKDNLGTDSVYQFNSADLYYTTDANYLVNNGDSGVFYTLISVEYLQKDGDSFVTDANGYLVLTDDAYKLLQATSGSRVDARDSYNGDINGDDKINIADANIVYQMTQYTGNYYTDALEINQRLMADMDSADTDYTADHRASIADVHEIVNIINGVS